MTRALVACFALSAVAHADEGMWLLDAFPKERVREKVGFEPSHAWLDHARLSSIRLARGCSSSFVSPRGLVLTNHHCAQHRQISSAASDLARDGFHARTAQERRCPEVELNRLVAVEDVTSRVNEATKDLEGARFDAARKAVTAAIQRACTPGGVFRRDVIALYQGARYHLYRYKRYQDVRLVFAPEAEVATGELTGPPGG